MLSRQNSRLIIRAAIFIVVLIGLPVGIFAFFALGTVCSFEPFFGKGKSSRAF